MQTSKLIKTILFCVIYGANLLLALLLWLCGLGGNILLGIIFIVLYRLSLWLSPLAVSVVCWLPLKPKVPARKKLVFNLVHLVLCAALFLICRLLFGNWY